jgi:hypothetical protein
VKITAPPARANPLARPDAAFVQLPVPATTTHPWIELTLTDGTLVRLPQQNLAALQMVLQACHGALRVPIPGAVSHV